MRWSPQSRVLVVYPLISTMLNRDCAHMSSRNLAELAYHPLITALQDTYSCTQISTLDLTPLLCFVTRQYFPPGFPPLSTYPPETLSLLTPRTLSSSQCGLLLRITRQWQSRIPTTLLISPHTTSLDVSSTHSIPIPNRLFPPDTSFLPLAPAPTKRSPALRSTSAYFLSTHLNPLSPVLFLSSYPSCTFNDLLLPMNAT